MQLLIKDPAKRLGSNGAQDVKNHPWFSEIDWKALYERKVHEIIPEMRKKFLTSVYSKVTPPFKPVITNEYDVNNFDEEFTNEGKMFTFYKSIICLTF